MSDYIKITDYAAKDALLTGNPAKLVKGVEIGADFDAVAVAIATKHDAADIGVTVQAYDADLTTWAGVTPGTGVATALAVNVGTAGSPVINGGALGSPSSAGTLPAFTLGGNVGSSGNPSLNIGTGALTAGAASFSSETNSGNLTFTGTGARITGDFSNGTVANRVMFQTSTAASSTNMVLIPSSGGSAVAYQGFTAVDVLNATTVNLALSTTEFAVRTGSTGSGTNVPMTFYTGGAERMRIDTSGQISAGSSNNANTTNSFLSGNAANYCVFGFGRASIDGYIGAATASAFVTGVNAGEMVYRGTAHVFGNNSGTLNFKVDTNGNVTAHNPAGALGYGTGAGGTVTQATSRTTGVTLNKPTGAITLFTAAGSATAATFTVTNSIVAATDTVVLSVKSSTNVYLTAVTAVAAGSFNITFWTTGGTSSDAPVINFAIIKGAAS